MAFRQVCLACTVVVLCAPSARSEVQIEIARSESAMDFTFDKVPSPATNDAATQAKWKIVDGSRDPNGGALDVLHDGKVPKSSDQPGANFFFRAGTPGGRILIDLEKVISVQRIGTWSWHTSTRAPQVYRIYGGDESSDAFNPEPTRKTSPESCGWKLIASVDTRSGTPALAGQHAVAVTDSTGTLGRYRYLLLDTDVTENDDAFGNTFFSEIDVVDADGPPLQWSTAPSAERILKKFHTKDDRFHFTVDATIVPELADWTDEKLAPVILEWYPKIVEMLPSKDFEARREVRLKFRDDMEGVPAWAAGGEVSMNARWFVAQKNREACGAVVHELVHVVQEYPRRSRPPGWLVEGIPDYIRWFLYEPQTKGAEITRGNLERARHNSSYRISANFLNWVSNHYDKDLVPRLNAAIREGDYREDLWKEWTGKTLPELEEEWKAFHEERLKGK